MKAWTSFVAASTDSAHTGRERLLRVLSATAGLLVKPLIVISCSYGNSYVTKLMFLRSFLF